MDSLRSSHRLWSILVVATLAGCAAPGAVIRGSLSLPGTPARAVVQPKDERPRSSSPIPERRQPSDRPRSGTAHRGERAAAARATAPDRQAPADPQAAESSPLSEAVLYIDRIGDARPPRQGKTTEGHMILESNGFQPRVVSVARGDSVVFENHDQRWHNAFSVSPARHFDLGSIPPGNARAVRFDRAGPVRVFCRLHADSSAYVFVAPNRYFARDRKSVV